MHLSTWIIAAICLALPNTACRLSARQPEAHQQFFCCRYSALKSLGEKKACFNEYLQQRKKDEKEEARVRAKQAREGFQTMLETSKDIKMSMRFSRARELFEDDPAWKVLFSPALYPLLFRPATYCQQAFMCDSNMPCRRREPSGQSGLHTSIAPRLMMWTTNNGTFNHGTVGAAPIAAWQMHSWPCS